MKIFETPVLNVKEFSRANIITLSGETDGQTAVQAANAKLEELKQSNPNMTILNFAVDA